MQNCIHATGSLTCVFQANATKLKVLSCIFCLLILFELLYILCLLILHHVMFVILLCWVWFGHSRQLMRPTLTRDGAERQQDLKRAGNKETEVRTLDTHGRWGQRWRHEERSSRTSQSTRNPSLPLSKTAQITRTPETSDPHTLETFPSVYLPRALTHRRCRNEMIQRKHSDNKGETFSVPMIWRLKMFSSVTFIWLSYWYLSSLFDWTCFFNQVCHTERLDSSPDPPQQTILQSIHFFGVLIDLHQDVRNCRENLFTHWDVSYLPCLFMLTLIIIISRGNSYINVSGSFWNK